MFIVGQALFETGMANKIGSLVTRFAKTERQCIIAVMLITGLMSGFLSNTGTAAVLIPVVIGIAASSDFSRGKLLMPLVFAAALGGNLSIIGAPGNLIGTNALNELGIETGFFEYIGVGLPMLVFGILYFAVFGYKLLPDNKDLVSADDDQFAAKDFSGVPVWKQTASLVILILSILAMIFEKQIGVKLHVSASVGAIILILTGVISEKRRCAPSISRPSSSSAAHSHWPARWRPQAQARSLQTRSFTRWATRPRRSCCCSSSGSSPVH